MESGSIANKQLKSSGWVYDFKPSKARLNGDGHWHASYIRPNWIQVDLLSAFIVTGLQTQGASDVNWYVKSLSVETGLLKSTLQPIMEMGTNITKVM